MTHFHPTPASHGHAIPLLTPPSWFFGAVLPPSNCSNADVSPPNAKPKPNFSRRPMTRMRWPLEQPYLAPESTP